MEDINYSGIDEATLIHALYHGTAALGLGILHHKAGLSVEDVAEDLKNDLGEKRIYFDYYRGHPLKLSLDTVNKTFNPRLYDRDAGRGAAERIVAQLKG
jgi:hypothetical protein